MAGQRGLVVVSLLLELAGTKRMKEKWKREMGMHIYIKGGKYYNNKPSSLSLQ